MPSLGAEMDEGTILEWRVAVGDTMRKGDVLALVDTDKAEIDVEVWHDAVVDELLVDVGTTVPVGTPIARLRETDAAVESAEPPPPSTPQEQPTAAPPVAPVGARTRPADDEPAPVTASGPAAPAATAERPDPRLVYWPGPDCSDESPTLKQAPGEETGSLPLAPSPAPPEEPRSRAERRQSAVAALMERSNREIPHFHLVREIDFTAALSRLRTHNEQVPPADRILPAALLLHAVAQAAQGSAINGIVTDEPDATEAEHVDLGVAVHLRGAGLITPVLSAAEEMSLDTLMAELKGLVARARAGALGSRDLTPATLTVTNIGEAGADQVLGVIKPPERALVGIGRIAERPVVVDGELNVRTTVAVTLTADHRVVNGHSGARFLDAMARTLNRVDDLPVSSRLRADPTEVAEPEDRMEPNETKEPIT